METKKPIQKTIVPVETKPTTAQPTTYSLGLIKVVEWNNERLSKDGNVFQSTTFNPMKSYKTDKDEWRDTSSFTREELIKLHTLIGIVLNMHNMEHLKIRGPLRNGLEDYDANTKEW